MHMHRSSPRCSPVTRPSHAHAHAPLFSEVLARYTAVPCTCTCTALLRGARPLHGRPMHMHMHSSSPRCSPVTRPSHARAHAQLFSEVLARYTAVPRTGPR